MTEVISIPNSPGSIVRSRLNDKVYLRCPEVEVVSRGEYWNEFVKSQSVFIRYGFPLLQLKPPYQWHQNPLNNASWLLYFHSLYFIGTIYHGINSFGATLDQQNDAIKYLKDLIYSYFDFLDTQPEDARIPAWDDHAAAYRASYLALAYANLLEPFLSADEKKRYSEVMRRHSKVLIEYIGSGKWRSSNHTIFQLEGLIDLALTFFRETREGLDILSKCKVVFSDYVKENVSIRDGTTKEHAHFYHPFLMERIRIHYYYLTSNGIESNIDILQVLRRMIRFLWLTMPTKGLMPPIGDTKYAMFINEKYYKAFVGETFIDSETVYFISEGTSGECPRYFHQFTDDGYYLFRDSANLRAGLISIFLEKKTIGPHGHVDGGSFVTYLGANPIFVDSGGPYKYKDALRFSYFKSQLAHNSLIIGAPTRHHSEVVASLSGSNFAFLGSRAHLSPGNTWYRVFGQVASNLIVVVDLAVCEDTSSPAQLRYHLAPEARFVDCDNGVRIIDVGGKKVYLNFQDAESLHPALKGYSTSPRLTRTFDARKFPLEAQSLSLITRDDGKSEPGHMICRSVEPYRPVCMLVGIGQPPVANIVAMVGGVELHFPPIGTVWPGGRLIMQWALDEVLGGCLLSFEPNA
jgi:hypothetical protein